MKLKNHAKYYEHAEDEYACLSAQENKNMSKILSNSLDLVNAVRLLSVSNKIKTWRVFGKSGYIPSDPLCSLDHGMVQNFGLGIRETDDDSYQMNSALCSKDKSYAECRALEEHHYWLSVFKKWQLEVYNVFEAYLQDPLSNEAKKPPSITWLNGGAGVERVNYSNALYSCAN
jgi:hypothetical protein